MSFTQEEVKNLATLLLSSQEENIKLAFAILEGKQYPKEISCLLDEYKKLAEILEFPIELTLEEICIKVQQSDSIKISSNIKEVGLFSNISHLSIQELDLFPNISRLSFDIIDKFCDFIEYFKNLTNLDIRGLPIKSLPIQLSEITSLEELYLGGSTEHLSQADFTVLKSLKNLRLLYLDACFWDTLPVGLDELISLEELHFIDNNACAKADFRTLATLKNLKLIYVEGIKLEHLPLGLDMLPVLEELSLCDNDFSEVDFTPLLKIKNLKKLDLSYQGYRWPSFKRDDTSPVFVELQKRGVEIKW